MDVDALRQRSNGRFFESWDDQVVPARVSASEASQKQLADDLIAGGPDLAEEAAREAVNRCVERFNHLDDDGWITTLEREDIDEQMGRLIDLCGFEYDEDWGSDRDW